MWFETGLVLLLSFVCDQAAGQCKDPMLFKLTEMRNQMTHLTERVESQVCKSFISSMKMYSETNDRTNRA